MRPTPKLLRGGDAQDDALLVPVKSAEQQAAAMVLKARDLLVRQRTRDN